MARSSLPLVLSFTGGYVDTAGFLALQGLFTAHVTGNFVTLGAALVFGVSGVVAKTLALPVFCAVVALVRAGSIFLSRRTGKDLAIFLGVKVLLLALGGGLAIAHGPFADGDSGPAIATGMILVAAMAIQNAIHRIRLASAPPTTLMTGSTTQIVIDAVDLLQGAGFSGDQRAATRARIAKLLASVLAFAFGCGLAALGFHLVKTWCFLLPPLLGATSTWLAFTRDVADPA